MHKIEVYFICASKSTLYVVFGSCNLAKVECQETKVDDSSSHDTVNTTDEEAEQTGVGNLCSIDGDRDSEDHH